MGVVESKVLRHLPLSGGPQGSGAWKGLGILRLSADRLAVGGSIASALLVIGATHDAFRWLAWVALVPVLHSPRGRVLRWTLFAVFMNGVFLLPYQQALALELVSASHAAGFYLGIVAATTAPYVMIDVVEAVWLRTGCAVRLRLPALAMAVLLVWLATDGMLGTKYWYALALDPAPLWLVRVLGEEGLAAATVGTSLVFAMALRETGARRCAGLMAGAGAAAWLCLGNPLADVTRRWPDMQVVGIQSGPSRSDVHEFKPLLSGLAAAREAGWAGGLSVLPELRGLFLNRESPSLKPFLNASRNNASGILLNGARETNLATGFERVSGIIENGTLQRGAVPKRHLVPYYESLRGPEGRHWQTGSQESPRVLQHHGIAIAPLLCFEVFVRSALRGVGSSPDLVVLSADISAFGHPFIDRYFLHAAAFQAQVARAPVVIVNSAGPSGVVFPDGSRIVVFRRGEAGAFRIARDGSVATLALP